MMFNGQSHDRAGHVIEVGARWGDLLSAVSVQGWLALVYSHGFSHFPPEQLVFLHKDFHVIPGVPVVCVRIMFCLAELGWLPSVCSLKLRLLSHDQPSHVTAQ